MIEFQRKNSSKYSKKMIFFSILDKEGVFQWFSLWWIWM